MKMKCLVLACLASLSAHAYADNGYSCNNVAGFQNNLDGSSAVVVKKGFKEGVSYRQYEDDFGTKGVRLTGEGINGGLCYDSVDAGNNAFATRSEWGFSCNNINPLGQQVNSAGTYPKVTLAKIPLEEAVDNYGIRLSGEGISGGLCFEQVSDAFSYLEFAKDGTFKAKGKFQNDDARISGRNGYIKISGNGVGGKYLVTWDN
ncbi:hypothetical protein JCM19232_3659 [Vibrio ishigakensis]|uniref:Maltoporin n=1 Tax=Vibrio ishigakensis TaxID=1481914 RepID=A0A0B8P815_9VIBR|nr:hypothetical protein JCM19232_3659 [Vibrio ishigakensis]